MSADVQPPAEALFYEALELSPPERGAFLNEACGADVSLRVEVDELLRAHDEAAGFLQVDAPASPELEAEFARLKPEEVGERIGNYKLLEQIGEGGFGVVWVAEQEKPMRRRVALKIIKLGMDTKAVIARFEQERQALAMMDHPNIAKVLEAGATPFGRPFFVMELVRGIKITEYCDQANLPTEERLRLFIAVCQAVQHAHQKGIIHRDLKPSNILVTLHDGVPVPKVIDFGVAKATQQQRLTDLTVYTQFEQMIGTPLYMSPEQAEMTGLDIDTRSDIYSLGVLLYELLAGRTPFDPEELMKRGVDEIRRAVREQEPQKPSTFVSTMAVDLRTNLAQHRQTDSAKLIGQIRGDLDWIVMKALEKDRTRRYETANGLAKDIERHLLSEPVHARPPTQFYRFRRFAKRNKLAFAAASAVLAALIIGLGVSTWMFFKEKQARVRAVTAEKAQSQERKKAETEAGKSRQVAEFLKDMLKGVGPSVALGRDTKMLREILDKTAERVGKDLKDQPGVEAELRNTLGEVYWELGENETAGAMLREALAMRRKLLGNDHSDVATSLHNMALVLERQGKLAKAETMHREALAMRIKLLGNEHTDVATSLNNLADVVQRQGKLAEAETLHRASLAMRRKLLGNEHKDVAESLNDLAVVLNSQGKPAEAETMLREALAMERKLLGSEHQDVAESLNDLAITLQAQGKLAEAETMLREALAMTRKLLGNEHPDVETVFSNLVGVFQAQGKLAEVETSLREAVMMSKKLLGDEHPGVATPLHNLAIVLEKQGKLAETEAVDREVVAIVRKSAPKEPRLEARIYDLAESLYRQSKYAEAEPLYREVIERDQARLGAKDSVGVGAIASLARLLADWAWTDRTRNADLSPLRSDDGSVVKRIEAGTPHEHAQEAERLLRDCLAIRLRSTDLPTWRTSDVRSRLGGALLAVAVTEPAISSESRLAKFAEAESLLLEGNEGLQPPRKYKRDALARLVRLYEAWDKTDKVAEWQQKLADFDKAEAKTMEEEKATSPKP